MTDLTLYALVRDGVQLQRASFAAQPTLAPNKGAWLPVVVVGEPAALKRIVTTFEADQVVDTWTDLPQAELKAAKLAEIEAANSVRKTTPFAWDFGAIATVDDNGDAAGPAGAQTLQVRDIEDEKNWLAAELSASAAIRAGAPDQVVPMKCTANLWIQVTAQQADQVLMLGDGAQASLFQRQAQILANYGRLKKAVADAADKAALDAIDVEAGWPA